MVRQKPRNIRNFMLNQDLPFGLIAKISILRFLEGFDALPSSTLKEIFNLHKFSIPDEFANNFIKELDNFLEEKLKIPNYLIKGIHLSENEDSSRISVYSIEMFLDKIYSSEFSVYFQNLDDDFLGKLNEFRSGYKKGVVYTPKTIIEHMSQDLLEYYINSLSLDLNNENQLSQKCLEKLTILDPAVGSGPFLVRFFEKLCEFCPECSSIEGKDVPKSILSNFYGIDIDQHAVYFARINLWLASIKFLMEHQKKFSFPEISDLLFPILEENIVLGDALLYVSVNEKVWNDEEVDLEEKIEHIIYCEDSGHMLQRFLERYFPKLLEQKFQGFSMIIGNPPYISSKDLPMDYKELLRALYETAVHQFDVYSIFIELSHGILSPTGFFAFIIPESYLGRSSFTESRWLLLNCTQILKIENIQNAFRKKSISNIILYFRNGEKQKNTFDFIFYDNKEEFKFRSGSFTSIPQMYCYKIQNFKILPHPMEIRQIIDKIHSNTIPLISYINIHRGEEIGKRSELITDKQNKDALKILSGENIKKFYIEPKNRFIQNKNIKKENAFYNQPKILVRQLGNRIQAAFDEKGEFVTLQTVYNITPSSKSISNEFLLALLNSNLIQFYYEVIFREKQIFPRILLENILHLPLVVPERQQHENLRKLVMNISNSFKTDHFSDKSLYMLNNEIYSLYGLNDKEKDIIENHLKLN